MSQLVGRVAVLAVRAVGDHDPGPLGPDQTRDLADQRLEIRLEGAERVVGADVGIDVAQQGQPGYPQRLQGAAQLGLAGRAEVAPVGTTGG
jgi:hypothetical protein